MKIRLNKRYLQISIYAAIAIAAGGILILIAANFGAFGEGFGRFSQIFKPIIWALIIAYILNPLVQFFEFKVFRSWGEKAETLKDKKKIHSFSLTLSVMVALIIIMGFLWLVLPQLVASIAKMIEQFDNLPTFFNDVEAWVNLTFGANSAFSNFIQNPLNEFEGILLNVWDMIKPQIVPLLSQMGDSVVNVLSTVFNIILAAAIAVNILLVKDMLLKQSRKVLYSVIPKRACNRFLELLGKVNKIFKKYMVSLGIDSVVVGLLCFIGSTIMGIQYSLLIGIIFAICNFIPMFGPFIGAVPAVLIILVDDPIKVIWFLIYLIIVQQVDGNIIAPIIHGESTGVPSVWVLISITVGGGLFGFIGMLFAVPVFAVIYMLVKELIESRLKKRDLPVSSNRYDTNLNFDGSVRLDLEPVPVAKPVRDKKSNKFIRFFKALFGKLED